MARPPTKVFLAGGYDISNVYQVMQRIEEGDKALYPILRANGMAVKQWCVNEYGLRCGQPTG